MVTARITQKTIQIITTRITHRIIQTPVVVTVITATARKMDTIVPKTIQITAIDNYS